MRARVALADSSILSAAVPTEADAVVLVDIVYVLFGLLLGFHSLPYRRPEINGGRGRDIRGCGRRCARCACVLCAVLYGYELP